MSTTNNSELQKVKPFIQHILLADDDNDDCLLFKEALEELRLPAKLTCVHNGEQLMQLLNKHEYLPSLLFLDVNMPVKNGFASLTEIKSDEILKSIPVIIFSTSLEPNKMQWLYENGAQQCLIKPNKFSQLKDLIFKAVTSAGQEM